jgi:hypothetical protein
VRARSGHQAIVFAKMRPEPHKMTTIPSRQQSMRRRQESWGAVAGTELDLLVAMERARLHTG